MEVSVDGVQELTVNLQEKKDLSIGDCMIIRVSGKKRTENFVGEVVENSKIDEEICIKFLVPVNGTKNTFLYHKLETNWHSYSDIVSRKLDFAEDSGLHRGLIKFTKDIEL